MKIFVLKVIDDTRECERTTDVGIFLTPDDAAKAKEHIMRTYGGIKNGEKVTIATYTIRSFDEWRSWWGR